MAHTFAVQRWAAFFIPAFIMTALDVLKTIRLDHPDLTPAEILAVLEDGAALAALGFTDEDQEAIEEAHHDLSLSLKSE